MAAQTEPPLECLKESARDLIAYDAGWLCDFCEDCPELYIHAATRTDPGDTDCIAGLNPMSECCHRHGELFEDEAVIESAIDQYAVDIDPQWQEPEVMGLLGAIDKSIAKQSAGLDTIAEAREGFYRRAVGIVRGDAA